MIDANSRTNYEYFFENPNKKDKKNEIIWKFEGTINGANYYWGIPWAYLSKN